MKKILFTVMAVAAICFATSCGNKAQQAEATDNTEEVAFDAEAAANGVIENLKSYIETKDTEKLQAALVEAKDMIAEIVAKNPEAAKEYVTKVQTYLKENAEQVKAVIGDNAAANAAVSALTELEPESVVNTLVDQANAAKEATENAAENAMEAAEQKVEDAKAAAEQKVEDAKAAAEQKAEDTKAAAKQKANDAVDNAAKNIKQGLGL